MTKRRRVIVLSPRLWQKQRNTLVLVPISTTAPFEIEAGHYQLTGLLSEFAPRLLGKRRHGASRRLYALVADYQAGETCKSHPHFFGP
jgi:mRNA-degrading endonuclease toxin of MazEF toxin-antitoxin module